MPSGAETLAMVREALAELVVITVDDVGQDALTALDGCILLTAEEANEVRRLIHKWERDSPAGLHALALLGANDART